MASEGICPLNGAVGGRHSYRQHAGPCNKRAVDEGSGMSTTRGKGRGKLLRGKLGE